MTSGYYMGIDLGTSSVRSVVFDRDGYPVLTEQRETPLITEQASWAELDPEQVFEQLLDVVQASLVRLKAEGKKLRGIGFSTQLHSLLAVDEQGQPLTRVMTWADSRATSQADAIARNFDCQDLYRKTGCRIQHPLYPLSKICWLRDQQPDIFARATRFLTLKSYLQQRLCGACLVDYTDASATGCFNIHTFTWDNQILEEVLGLDADRFARPVACTEYLPPIDSKIAASLGLDPNIPLVVGSGDGILANLGCGIFDDTAMTSTIGTSGAMRTTVPQPLLDEKQRTWCYCLTRDRWVAGGAINNGGLVLRWLRDQFRDTFQADADRQHCRNIYKLFDHYAATIPAGSDQLLFLPLLTGERSPNWNARTRGVLFGLDLRHGRGHLVKAAMEGILYQMFSVYQALASFNPRAEQIRANGGYARSDIWLQIQADLFAKPIAVSTVSEASALGAAYLAMLADGQVNDLADGLPAMAASRIFQPDQKNADIYQTAYRQYLDIYDKLYRV